MTFTEKAARELRQRIRKQSRERLLAGADIAHWRGSSAHLRRPRSAPSTSSAASWLRRHSLEAGIDPDFAILDASIAGTVRDEVLARCLRQWLAERDADLIDLAVEFGLRRVREALAGLIAERDAGRPGRMGGPRGGRGRRDLEGILGEEAAPRCSCNASGASRAPASRCWPRTSAPTR